MGAFKTQIMRNGGWWDIDYLEREFYRYINADIEEQSSALRFSPNESKERGFYDYVFGMDNIPPANRKTPIELGTIACLFRDTRKALDKVATHNLDAARHEQQVKAKLTELLGYLDDYADKVNSLGGLKIKASMREIIFRGEWNGDVDNSIPPQSAQACNPYNLKHFGADSKAARYINYNRNAVKSMEDKAVEHGLLLDDGAGGAIFRFNATVGWDGEVWPAAANTTAIRVDSLGTKQHSHPLAETGSTFPSFQGYVISEIMAAAKNSDVDRLVEIAKFIIVCGGTAKEFVPPGKFKAEWKKSQEEGMKLPDCKFW